MENVLSGREVTESSKLDGINYTLWSFKLGTILQGERVWQVVDPNNLPQTPRSSSLTTHATPANLGESSVVNTAASVLAGGNTKVTATPQATHNDENLRYCAMHIIIPTIKDSIMPHIMNIDDARQVWIKLLSLYQNSSMNRRLSLKSQFYSLKMMDKMTIEEHLRTVSSLTSQLANIGIAIPNEELVDCILISLLSNWETFRQMVSCRE
jgi:hypothetical protein